MLRDAGVGRHVIEARAIGFEAGAFAVSTPTGTALRMRIVLRPAVVLVTVRVQVRGDSASCLPPSLGWPTGFAN